MFDRFLCSSKFPQTFHVGSHKSSHAVMTSSQICEIAACLFLTSVVLAFIAERNYMKFAILSPVLNYSRWQLVYNITSVWQRPLKFNQGCLFYHFSTVIKFTLTFLSTFCTTFQMNLAVQFLCHDNNTLFSVSLYWLWAPSSNSKETCKNEYCFAWLT